MPWSGVWTNKLSLFHSLSIRRKQSHFLLSLKQNLWYGEDSDVKPRQVTSSFYSYQYVRRVYRGEYFIVAHVQSESRKSRLNRVAVGSLWIDWKKGVLGSQDDDRPLLVMNILDWGTRFSRCRGLEREHAERAIMLLLLSCIPPLNPTITGPTGAHVRTGRKSKVGYGRNGLPLGRIWKWTLFGFALIEQVVKWNEMKGIKKKNQIRETICGSWCRKSAAGE